MTALCEGYKGTSTSWPLHLTHHANNPTSHPQWDFLKRRNDAKRRQQCPNLASNLESCPYETQRLHLAIGHTDSSTMKLECDEFPWASSEEGGNYLPASERSQVCIPSVQNGLGGNCIGKHKRNIWHDYFPRPDQHLTSNELAMLNFLETNVGKLEPGIAKLADRKSQWLYWGGQAGNDMDCE